MHGWLVQLCWHHANWDLEFRRDRGGNQSSSLLPGEHGNGQVVRQSQLPERFQYSVQGRDPGGCRQSSARVTAICYIHVEWSIRLQFGDLTLQSEEGAQQGNPLGPLYFCLAIVELLKSMKSELVLAYLDDTTLGDNAETVLKDILQLEEVASRIGLKINRDKCEVVGHTVASSLLFTANNVTLPDISPSSVILPGCTTVSWSTSRLDA